MTELMIAAIWPTNAVKEKVYIKKMFNQDKGKIECAVGNREICFWQDKKTEIVLILFLTSGFAVYICLGLLVPPNSNTKINHLLLYLKNFLVKIKYIFKKPISCTKLAFQKIIFFKQKLDNKKNY